jgi:hypothetical protein
MKISCRSILILEIEFYAFVFASVNFVVTYTYSCDGLKRSEVSSGGTTTLVWDGSEYLQGRS